MKVVKVATKAAKAVTKVVQAAVAAKGVVKPPTPATSQMIPSALLKPVAKAEKQAVVAIVAEAKVATKVAVKVVTKAAAAVASKAAVEKVATGNSIPFPINGKWSVRATCHFHPK